MEERIKNVMAAVFGIDVADISDNASPDTVAGWDSIGHMKLVIAIEEEFGIQFGDEQIADLLNIALIRIGVSECLKTEGSVRDACCKNR